MNKIYFYLLYIPIGFFVIFSIGPYLQYKKYLKDKIKASEWLGESSREAPSQKFCNFCEGKEFFEECIFRLPKSIKKGLFSYSESNDCYKYISVRCKVCQSEIERRMS
jgi:hypothetical protein